MRSLSPFLVAALLMLFDLSAAEAARIALTGSVTYRERLLLPQGAEITVSLVDLSAPDHPLATARTTTTGPGRPPLAFTLGVEETLLKPGRTYGLVAEIATSDGAYWFRSPAPVGLDAADVTQPVELAVAFEGRKPDPEESFARLFDAEFQVDTLPGTALNLAKRPTFRISSDLRVSGSSGCNNWFAQAELDGHALSLSPVAATRMACAPDLMAQEAALFAALGKVRNWRFNEVELTLGDEADTQVLILRRAVIN